MTSVVLSSRSRLNHITQCPNDFESTHIAYKSNVDLLLYSEQSNKINNTKFREPVSFKCQFVNMNYHRKAIRERNFLLLLVYIQTYTQNKSCIYTKFYTYCNLFTDYSLRQVGFKP